MPSKYLLNIVLVLAKSPWRGQPWAGGGSKKGGPRKIRARPCRRAFKLQRQEQAQIWFVMPQNPKSTGLYHDGTAPKAPSGLGRAGVSLWDAIHGEYQIDDEPSRQVLRSACECIDRAEAAKVEVSRDGMTVQSNAGSLRPHRALAVEATFSWPDANTREVTMRMLAYIVLVGATTLEVAPAMAPRGLFGSIGLMAVHS